MKFIYPSMLLTILAASWILCSSSQAREVSQDTSRILATVPVKGNVDQSVYTLFDRIVPELRKVSKDNIIKLECRYSGNPAREKDVINAYQIAAKVEKYLRTHHNLELDLWITLQMAAKQTKAPVLTIALFTDEIKQLSSMPVVPKKSE